ncbi:MAG: YqaE/Pmp3 family membrane protein [Chitinophagaceae bacterium]|nr:MAG: YqaE/Pmp3 family membrane protein [Chitinophagaceae bacterium]
MLVVLSLGLLLSDATASLSVPPNGEPDAAKVRSALSEFTHLKGKERRARLRAVKSEVRQFKADKRAGREPKAEKVVQVICAILLPPLGVYLHEGTINTRFWICLLLTLLLYIPGLIYALVIILGDK